MSPERWEQINQLLKAALECAPEERADFLAQACAGDAPLCREIESLLASDDQSGHLLAKPPDEVDGLSAGSLTSPSLVGQQISHYQVLSFIGAGGMGEVYLAQDVRLARKIALKLLPAQSTQNPERVWRFRREALAASALSHPNIITLYEIGEAEGTHFIATEYVEGETLRQRIAGGALTIPAALDIAAQIASALQAAHAAGIVHRDIKPANVMLRPDALVKVLDFGLAKLTEKDEGGRMKDDGRVAPFFHPSSLIPHPLTETETGMVLGTLRYMSPEQARGQKVDARTDIFSLGVVMYEMLTGQLPFAGANSADVLAAMLTKEPEPLHHSVPEVPAALEEIIRRALCKEREQRYQTAKQLLADLVSLKQELELEARLSDASRSGSGRVGRSGESAATGRVQGVSTGQTNAAFITSKAEYLLGQVGRHRRGVALSLIGLVVIVSTLAAYFVRGGWGIDSIVVLPLVNASGDPNTEYLSDGVTESLINQLTQLRNLRVMARTTAFRYKGKDVDPQQVGRELGVQAVLTGRLQQYGDDVTLQFDLVKVADGTQLWGEQYHRKLSDLRAVQQKVGQEVAEKLRLYLNGAEREQLSTQQRVNPEAYQAYLRARYYYNKGTPEGWKKTVEYFQQAIDLDPNFAPAYAGLADTYVRLSGNFLPPHEAHPKARAAALKALELDATLAEAYTQLGLVKLYYEWDWPAAGRELQRALELNPNFADGHSRYGTYLMAMGRANEAIAEMKRAQQVDPVSLRASTHVGWAFFHARRYDEAVATYHKTLELDPNYDWAHQSLGWAYLQQGKFEEAVAEFERARQLNDVPYNIGGLAPALTKLGRSREAQQVLADLRARARREYMPIYLMAIIYSSLGDKDQALTWLEQGYAARADALIYLKVDPRLDELRADARFTDLLRRVGFQP
jgi:serine/threonine-protein kinase